MEWLILSRRGIEDLLQVKELRGNNTDHVTKLYLDKDQIQYISSLRGMTQLTVLAFGNKQLQDICSTFRNKRILIDG